MRKFSINSIIINKKKSEYGVQSKGGNGLFLWSNTSESHFDSWQQRSTFKIELKNEENKSIRSTKHINSPCFIYIHTFKKNIEWKQSLEKNIIRFEVNGRLQERNEITSSSSSSSTTTKKNFGGRSILNGGNINIMVPFSQSAMFKQINKSKYDFILKSKKSKYILDLN